MRYFIFIDESGDSHLGKTQTAFDVFVLCGAVISETEYDLLDNEIKGLKAKHFCRPDIYFHFEEMRSRKGEFKLFENKEVLENFRNDLHHILISFDFKILAVIIDKPLYRKLFPGKSLLYEESFTFICEQCAMMVNKENKPAKVQIILEKRHARDDAELKKYYSLFLREGTPEVPASELSQWSKELNFRSKIHNITGLQLTDMCAYPIARKYLTPESQHPIYEIIRGKFCRNKKGKIDGKGLLVLPKNRRRAGFRRQF
jgi:hypothetical protein